MSVMRICDRCHKDDNTCTIVLSKIRYSFRVLEWVKRIKTTRMKDVFKSVLFFFAGDRNKRTHRFVIKYLYIALMSSTYFNVVP